MSFCDNDPERMQKAVVRTAARAAVDDDPERALACLSFCQQFPTEFLAARQLVRIDGKEQFVQGRENSLADIPGFDGLVAVRMMPVQTNEGAKS